MNSKSVKFKAVVTNISIMDTPLGDRLVKIDLTEDREGPGTLIMQPKNQPELAREIVPVLSQVLRSMPFFGTLNKYKLPRLSLYLTEEEWDKLVERPTIGDVIEVEVTKESVVIRK